MFILIKNYFILNLNYLIITKALNIRKNPNFINYIKF